MTTKEGHDSCRVRTSDPSSLIAQLRVFGHLRSLLGARCRLAWETEAELMAAVQTAGDQLHAHPHVAAIVPRGGRDRAGS